MHHDSCRPEGLRILAYIKESSAVGCKNPLSRGVNDRIF